MLDPTPIPASSVPIHLLQSTDRPLTRWALGCLLLAVALAGCGRRTALVPTPHIMVGEPGRQQFEQVPTPLQTPEAPIVFFTDRQPEDDGGFLTFGHERSGAISFGTARVVTDPALDWPDLVRVSTAKQRRHRYGMLLDRVEIAGQVSPIESLLSVVDGRLVYTQNAWDLFIDQLDTFDAELNQQLQHDPDGEVILFVHGFHNDFESAAVRLAAIWHAGGRVGVPVLFSWPAGEKGLLPIAYNHDRESGEFSIRHLKIMLFALARNPKVQRVHLIAHSRGTDVVVTTLREIKDDLWGVYGGSAFMRLAVGAQPNEFLDPPGDQPPKSAPDTLKLDTLVLASADIDRDVFIQRFIVEQVTRLARRTVIYTSPDDLALRASVLFTGGNSRRLGQQGYTDFPTHVRSLLTQLPSFEFIECHVHAKNSHAYAFEHPAALSDMIRLIRDATPAGTPRRPLHPIAPNFWRLDDDYLSPSD